MSHSRYAMPQPAALRQDGRFAELGRRISPFGALVWKEWREQRLIWAALMALLLAAEVAVRLAPDRGDLREVLWLLIPFLWGSMATLLGANAFAGDRDTDTESFMGALPVSRRFRFWVKIGVVAALLWTAQTLTALCMPQTNWFSVDPGQPAYFMSYFLVSFSLGMILLSLAAACVASWASSTLSTVIQTALVGPCLLACMAFMGRLLYAMCQTGYFGDATTRWGALATALVLAHAAMLAGACWLWTAADGGLFRHVRRAAAVLALFLLVLLAPPAVLYARATLMAPVFPAGWKWIMPSPAGRYALIYFAWPEGAWRRNARVVLLDTETARTVRLSRLRESSLIGWALSGDPDRRGIWSPDGARFAFITSDQWAFPVGCLRSFPPWAADGGKSWWVDAAGGEAHNFRSFSEWYGPLAQYSWWWDDRTLAFHEGTGMVFQDIHTGERRFCADKVPAKEISTLMFDSAKCSATGIWFLTNTGALHCYRPGATAASVVEIQMPRSEPRQWSVDLNAISPDGRRAIFLKWDWTGRVEVQRMICSLETGMADEIGPLGGNLPGRDLRESFTRDGQAVLLCGSRGVGLWDVGKRKLEMLYAAPPDLSLFPGELSPSGKYLCVALRPAKSEVGGMKALVIDVATKRASPLWKFENGWVTAHWLEDDQLLVCQDSAPWMQVGPERVPEDHTLWIVSRDGTSKRKVLP